MGERGRYSLPISTPIFGLRYGLFYIFLDSPFQINIPSLFLIPFDNLIFEDENFELVGEDEIPLIFTKIFLILKLHFKY